MSYESALFSQAEPRIVRGSTIERKQMSTKTTIKRIALVSVAALSLGVLSVAPSNAAAQLDSLAVSATSTTQVAGSTAATTEVVVTASLAGKKGVDTITVTATIVSGPAYIAPVLTFKESTTATVDSTVSDAVTVTGRETGTVTQATAKWTLALNAPTVAGTYVVKLTPTGGANAVATSVSITVAPKVIGWTSAFISTNTSTGNVAADVAVAVASTASATSVGRINVTQGYGTVVHTDTDTVGTDTAEVVVTTTKGLISKTNDYTAASKSVTTAAKTASSTNYWIFSNGDVGAASITVTVGGVLKATKTATFTGPATALVAGTPGAKFVGVAATTTISYTSTDAAATAVNNPTGLTVTTSDSSVATASLVVISATSATVTITGVKAGTSVITVSDTATTSAAASAAYTITVKAVRPTTAPTITFDKSSYNVGDVVTMTVNADMADSATVSALFTTALVTSAPVTAVAGTTALSTSSAAHAIASGVATYKFYAPAVSGSFTVTGTPGSTVDTTAAAVAVTATVAIVNPGVDAATAAAELAEAAAQDATDAALDATSAAELAGALAQEAVEAVAELSAQVATLIAALKKQITTLTNLVIKIQKKVGAK